MRRGLIPIYSIAALDAMGIGIVFPTLPGLLRSLLHTGGDVARQYGFLLAVYAATMWLSSPVLGILSDRFGRRPVLLFSLVGTAFDDLVMTLAPTLSVLYIGRTLAGLTGANYTVANAYLADVTPEADRAAAFGRMSAFFGLGFVAGPVLGALAGLISLRAPFAAAAVLNLLGGAVCWFVLPESRAPSQTVGAPFQLRQLNPVAALLSIGKLRGVGKLLYVFCTMTMVGQVPAVLWVIYGMTRFGWSTAVVGLSFAVFGLLHAVCQSFLPGWSQRRLGLRGTVMAGMAVDSFAFAVYSGVRSSAAAFSVIPLLSVGGVAESAVQSLLTGTVAEERQGELQGVLTSLLSLISVIGPLLVTNLYAVLLRRFPAYPGSIWLCALVLYAPCLLVLRAGRHFVSPVGREAG